MGQAAIEVSDEEALEAESGVPIAEPTVELTAKPTAERRCRRGTLGCYQRTHSVDCRALEGVTYELEMGPPGRCRVPIPVPFYPLPKQQLTPWLAQRKATWRALRRNGWRGRMMQAAIEVSDEEALEAESRVQAGAAKEPTQQPAQWPTQPTDLPLQRASDPAQSSANNWASRRELSIANVVDGSRSRTRTARFEAKPSTRHRIVMGRRGCSELQPSKRGHIVIDCQGCGETTDKKRAGEDWIACDDCNSWHHCRCVGRQAAEFRQMPFTCERCSGGWGDEAEAGRAYDREVKKHVGKELIFEAVTGQPKPRMQKNRASRFLGVHTRNTKAGTRCVNLNITYKIKCYIFTTIAQFAGGQPALRSTTWPNISGSIRMSVRLHWPMTTKHGAWGGRPTSMRLERREKTW